MRRLASSVLCHCLSRRSMSPICWSSLAIRCHCSRSVRQPLHGIGDTFPDARLALRHDFAVFSQQSAQAVDLGGTELHVLLAHAMQGQHGLLRFGLDGHRFDARLLDGRPRRPRVPGVVFVARHKWLDPFAGQQPDLMPQSQ